MTEKNPDKGYVALLGWSLNAIDAVDRFDRRYVVVAPPWAEDCCQQNEIPFVPWDFDRLNERSHELAQRIETMGVDVAIPIFEETVEWAGAINAVLLKNPRLPGQAMLFRDKALMKRRAQPGGIRAGVFQAAHDKNDAIRFPMRAKVPEETADHPYFEFHELSDPREQKVANRSAFGAHCGFAYFFGDNPHQLRDLPKQQEELDYYV